MLKKYHNTAVPSAWVPTEDVFYLQSCNQVLIFMDSVTLMSVLCMWLAGRNKHLINAWILCQQVLVGTL